MRTLNIIILALIATAGLFSQSPHGKNLKIKCNVCHNADSWKINEGVKSFNHNKTGFPLTGQHGMLKCKQCHTDLVFSNARKECSSCHTDMHQQTVGRDCDRCHNTSSWVVKNIRQLHQQTRFPLVGAHAQADCSRCHKSASMLRFDPMGTNCIDCHRAKYIAAPNHVAGRYSQNCEECHNMGDRVWKFNHLSFPLKGGHAGVDCIKCHANGYKGTSPECKSCHMAKYNATTSPSHVLAKIPTDCKSCHTINAWKPASFDHNKTSFPLRGAHVGVDCIKCHAAGYVNTPKACVSCHLAKYNATPSHTASKFPTTCETCHSVNGWKPATFNHSSYFNITNSRHNVSCSVCHTNPTNYAQFTCYTASCHPKAVTDSHHSGVRNYVYNSINCYSCHPR